MIDFLNPDLQLVDSTVSEFDLHFTWIGYEID